jgi:hypothetical protein
LVTATGVPTPTLTEAGGLPAGVSFVDNGDGTGALAGTPGAGTGGIYALVITASNGVGDDALQDFTLTVNEGPAFTTGTDQTTFDTGVPSVFTFTTSGVPTPALTETGALPPGVAFADNGDGTASLLGIPAPGSDGAYSLVISASNGVGNDAIQNFTLNVVTPTPAPVFPPAVLSLRRIGYHVGLTHIVLSFTQPMDAARASLASNYFFQPVKNGKVVKSSRGMIRVSAAMYNPDGQTVTLTPVRRLNLHHIYQITANGRAPQGLTNQIGILLDGANTGVPGSNFVFKFAGLPSLANIPGPGQAQPIGRPSVGLRAAAVHHAARVNRLPAPDVRAGIVRGGLGNDTLSASNLSHPAHGAT